MSCIRENLRVRSFIFIGLVTILITASFSDKVFAQKSKIKYDGDYFYETVTGYVGDEKIYSLNKKQPLFWNELANDFETLKIKFDEGYSPAYIDIDKGEINNSKGVEIIPPNTTKCKIKVIRTVKLRRYNVYVWKYSPSEQCETWVLSSKNVKSYGVVKNEIFCEAEEKVN